jgi:hypothetical protein
MRWVATFGTAGFREELFSAIQRIEATSATSSQNVERFEKLSLGRLGKPACLRAGDEQLIGKPLERLLWLPHVNDTLSPLWGGTAHVDNHPFWRTAKTHVLGQLLILLSCDAGKF